MLRDRVWRVGRHAGDGQTQVLRGLKIDVVEARGPQSDEPDARLGELLQTGPPGIIVDEQAGRPAAGRQRCGLGREPRFEVPDRNAGIGRVGIERLAIESFGGKEGRSFSDMPLLGSMKASGGVFVTPFRSDSSRHPSGSSTGHSNGAGPRSSSRQDDLRGDQRNPVIGARIDAVPRVFRPAARHPAAHLDANEILLFFHPAGIGSRWNTIDSMTPMDAGPPTSRPIARLVEEHAGQLYQLAFRFCGSRDEAEDLVQEVFLHAHRSWDGFRGESSEKTWLYKIAARACQRMHRKRSCEPDQIGSLHDLLPFGDPLIAVIASEQDDLLQQQIWARSERAARNRDDRASG